MKAAAAVAATVALAAAVPAARADEGAAAAPVPKKLAAYVASPGPSADTRAARAAWDQHLDKLIGAAPEALINIHNLWTRENMAVAVDPDAAAPVPQERIDVFFRCHFTNQPTDMDPRLFPMLLAAARHFKVGEIDIVSGFRSPKFNLTLRKKGHQVARHSQHVLGHAIDFRLPGVDTATLRAWVRAQKLGGVGYYPFSKFVHMDVGPVRTWRGR